MNTPPKDHAVGNMRAWSLILLFLLVLSLPALDWLFKLDNAPQAHDNRAPAAWPAVPDSLQEARSWTPRVEAYFNDHFGFRNRLIQWHNRWKKGLFRDLSGAEVIAGKDGWLFYSCCAMIDHFVGSRPFDQPTLERLKTLLEARHRWLRNQGIAYVFVVAPNKESIYPEHLPQWLSDRAASQAQLDQFYQYMRSHSDVPVVDVRAALLEAKTRAPLYQRTDSHWNDLGSWIAMVEIGKHLGEQVPGLAPLPAEDLLKLAARSQPPGDLAKMLGQTSAVEDLDPLLLPPEPWHALDPQPLSLDSGATPASGSARHEFTLNARGTVDALVFHDSFGAVWRPWFGHLFHRTSYVRTAMVGNDEGGWHPHVTKIRPKVVIDEMVERGLLELTSGAILDEQLPD